ncbi:MAG: formylglycine-generating enzyme family protein [Planctomyces sp.]|nr:formylglycine-generating enzyme family protein [Planctomyces sp.]
MKKIAVAFGTLLCVFAILIWTLFSSDISTPTGSPETAVAELPPAEASPESSDPRLKGMVWIPGGTFQMGSLDGAPDEYPVHEVRLDGFWMDQYEVTNRQFQAFVEATGYVTTAEQPPKLRSLEPGSGLEDAAILEEFNHPGSICSLHLNSRNEIDPEKGAYSWWQYVKGANWKHPEGPESNIESRLDHPVVHLSWLDVEEYCRWAGKKLPTEAQWEYAARGGRENLTYPWGNDRNPDGQWLHNIWQGEFPISNTGADGHIQTSPVGSFPANGYNLFDMSGNVWEWCADYYQPQYYSESPLENPQGPDRSFDPQEPGIIKRVQRGGSFMCSEQYCVGYRVSSRMKGEQDTGAFHTGFRCVVTPNMVLVKDSKSESEK